MTDFVGETDEGSRILHGDPRGLPGGEAAIEAAVAEAEHNADAIRSHLAGQKLAWWHEHGYLAGRHLEDDLWLCVGRMIFTWRVMLCTTEMALEFYCYEDLTQAMQAYEQWDGRGENPVPGWTRHHG